MIELVRRWSRRPRSSAAREPVLSFGSWDQFPDEEPRIVQVCHPDWRGVRTATYAFRSPVIEVDDLDRWTRHLVDKMTTAMISLVVIQGWPPGSSTFAAACHTAGVAVKCVLHSSPALQEDVPAEARVVEQTLSLRRAGVIRELAMVKPGVSEALTAAGHEITYMPNRAPILPDVKKAPLGPGLHVGIFGEPWWPKNVATQVMAAGLLKDSVIHLTRPMTLEYLSRLQYRVHGELAWSEFMSLLGSMDLNLNVALTDCHPLLPVESYLLDVPCLMSRTSSLFRDDQTLWEATTVDSPDEPVAIARAAEALLARDGVVEAAKRWIASADIEAAGQWRRFTTIN